MNMDDNKKKLYDALSEEYDMGTFEQFCSDINDDEKRKKLYDATINEYDFGDYDSFSKQLLGDRYGAKIQDAVDPKNVVHPEWEQQSYSPNPEILTDGYLPKSLNLAANPANLGTLQAGDKEGKEVLNESGEQVKPENLSISNWPGEEEEYVEGFGEGLKQGWQGLKEGAKFFAGETANLFSGSSLDDERALATLERLQAEGKTDYIDGSGNTYVADKGLRADLKLIREAIQEAGGDMDKAKRILSERAADKSWGDSMMESAKEGMNAMKPTKGFGAWVGNLVPQMIPSAAAIALSFVTKNPKYAQMVGGIGMGGMTASTAGQSMKEARDAGATNGEVWAVGIADGVIEYATEKLPFDNYTRKLFNGVKHKVGGEMAEAANYVSSPGRAELEELLTKANKKLGGRLFNGKNVKDYLASIAEEGLSEFTAEALQTITPMIYENPENYPVLTDILSSGWEGAKAGLFMGSVLGGASKIAEHRQQRARRQEQGFVDVAQVHLQDEKGSAVDDVVEVVGKDKESGDLQVLHEGVLKSVKKDDVVEEHRFSFEEFDNAELNMEADESYQNGYSLKTPQEMSDAQNMYEFQRKRLSEQLGVEPDAMDEYIVDPINFIKEQRQLGASDEDIRSILDYSNAKQTYEGMIQRVRDDIDDAVGQAASIVQMRTNRDTGMVQGATMKLNDRRVYVVSGNVVQYTDGKGIDHANSDNSIIIRDAETNEIEMVSPDVLLSVDAPLDANELLMQEEQAISEQIAREAADKMEGKVTAWNEGDTYTITDDNGQHVQVRLVANELSGLVDNGDGTVNATVDGKTIIEIPKEQIQQAVDEANMARVASYAATNEAKEVEEKTAATLPEYGFNYKVTLQSKDGEEITGTIGDVYDDEVLSGGEREFVVNIDELSSSINGKRSPKLTQSELNDMVVSVQDADGNLVWQREDLATEAAENVTKGAEGVPENTENVPENAENVQNNGRKSDEAGERTDNNGIVMKDDGSPDLAASGALNALGFLRERYKEEAKVQRKIETTRDYYGKELEKVQKVLDKAQQEFDDAPFGFEDKAEAKLQKAQQDYDAVKREVDLWTELYNMLIADRVKENSEVVSEIEDMGEPLNGEELAAMMLINGQIHLLREDYLRETGYSNQEANKLFGLFRSKENGGVTVEQAGEMVMLADNEDGTHFFDEADANAGRNAVLEVLFLVHTPSDLRDYIKNRREQQAQRELEAEREYYENMIERDFHMTLEEYEDYVYLLSKENPFEDIDVAEIDAIFAEAANEYEEFFKQQEYEQGRTDEFIEGGNDVLPEERADDSPGTEEGEGSRETEGAGSGTAGKDGTSSGYDGREVTEESSVQPTVQAQIDAAEAETDTNPTDAQKEAGNYKKGHVQLGTFDISIEQPKGSVRSGVDADGKKWETKMQNTYGYIRGTEGVDGDHIDVFLANDVDAWNGRKVFVVDQYNEDGSFDEHKVMLGFNEQEEAEDAYFANYDKDWSKKHKTMVTSVNLEDFEKWIQSSHRKTKAFAEYKSVKNSGESAGALEYSITPAQYTTKRGKVLDMQLVTFKFELHPIVKKHASDSVRHGMKGWWDRERNGFMLRNLEDAKHIADYVVDAQSKLSMDGTSGIKPSIKIGTSHDIIPNGENEQKKAKPDYSGKVTTSDMFPSVDNSQKLGKEISRDSVKTDKNVTVSRINYEGGYMLRASNDKGDYIEQSYHPDGRPMSEATYDVGVDDAQFKQFFKADANGLYIDDAGLMSILAANSEKIKGEKDDQKEKKEHYPAISERSENGMAQRIASYKDKVLTEMRDNAELEITAMKEEEGVFGERVPVVSGEFPKGLPEHKVVTKKQKGGKSTVAENVYVAMVNGDLYVKRYVRGEDLKNISVRIPGAKKYDFNEIKYRLELGIGTSTDAVRLMGDAIDELYKRGDFQESIFEKAERIAKEFEERTKKQAEAAQETHHEVYPISTSSRWGKVYQWSVGSFKDAVDFLMNKKDGMLKGVFYRDEIGEIGVGWGVAPNDFNGRGLSHIVRKHVNKLHDFSDVDEMIRVVEDVINHGVVRKDKDDSYAIENDTYRVVVVKDEDGAWVLSAFDYVNSKKEKAKRKDTAALGTPGQSNVEAGAVTSNLSRNKDNELASEKQLLNENEIRESPFSEIMKDGAMAYINGNINFATSVAYQQIYNYVWNRSENNQSYSTGRSAAQRITTVDEASGRRGGLNGVQTGRMAGETDQPGGSQNSKRVGVLSDRAGSDTAVRGEISADGGLSSGDTGRKGGSRTGSKGDNVRKPESERGSSGTVGESVEEGGDSSNRGNIESCKDELKALLLEYEKASKKGLSLSVIGMNAEQIEIAGKILVAGVKLGYAYLKAGVIKFEHWNKAMHNDLALPFATSMHLSNAEIDVFIGDMWEYPYKVDGETRLLREWASIIGKAELRKKVGESLEEKRKAQAAAEPVAVKVCDRNNIAETLPFLLPQQQEDVMKAETQFFDDSHNDRDHAFGKGYMFTNGTGTGKTYTGLGIVKRFIKQGKGRILILTPSQTKVKDWVDDAKNLGIELNDLDAVAKAKKDGATATTEKGEGAVITTYANFRQNKALLEDLFDLIVYDESHRLLENKDGIGTAGSLQHYKLSNRNNNYSYLRLQEINPVWNDYQAKIEEFDAEREKLIERLKKEYGIANELALGQRGGLPPALNGNWTGDMERKFPELAKLRNEVNTLGAKYEKEIKPKLEEEAKANMKHTKVVFLSATPFNTRENLDYAEGYIFSYPENDRQVGYANQSPRSQFYLEHFGAGYRWRYNRLESSSSNAAAVSKQEVEFSDYLQHALQTMSGRVIDSPYDYSRDFPTVTMEKAETFNSAMEELSRDEATSSGYREVMGDYNYTSALFESMKVSQIIPRLKAHLERGRKVVIFHRRVDSREPLRLPFAAIFAESARLAEKESDAQEKAEKKKRIASLKRKYADLLAWEQGLDLRMPREQLADAFGKDDVLFFSGKEGEKAKKKAVKDFNSDTSGKNIMVIQEASGKEGISLHDTTGVHQRVLVTLALPQSPITALQIEGRIYRIGNKSNAIFEYPLLGLNAEMMLFGQKFNEQVSTTENLALGSQARNLRESFARGVEEHSGNVDIDGQGVGGKELDAPSVTETDAFDRAVLDYYTNQKLAGRRDSREGQDYYPTPEPLGYMMNQWGQIGEGESVLEPSAGHGAIARYVPKENLLTAVEPSQRLFSKLQIKAGGNGRKFENDVFENYNVVNKHDVVLMNPPFGVGGRMAVDHVAKAFQHLDEGGRVVAIIPRGSTDKKFEKWYEGQKDAVLTAEIGLPDITFERAGTSVNCRVVVIDKVTNKDLRGDAASRAVHMDLSGMHFDKIEDFFEEIRDIRVPERTIDHKAKMKKKATPVARELRGMKGIKKVELNEERIFVDGRGVWASLQWGDWQGDALTRHLANEYVRFRKSEEYAADRENNIQIEVYGELKELCCKLAGLTEDEMQRYIERSGKDADEDLYREDDDLEEVNERFNEQLESLTEENAQGVILDLGRPGDILLSAGLSDREIRLYGNKVMKKIRKHGFAISSIKNLPVAINHPIAVFNNYGNEMNRAILTELKTPQGNVLATIEWGKGTDAELNIVTSVFGKGKENVIGWINKGYATYISKEKALDYLRIPAPIAGAQDSQELSSATKIVKEFENPSIDGEDLYREVTDDSELAWLENQPTVKAYRAMQVIDGRLYSPMASGKKKNLGAGYGLNKWDVATEMAFNVTDEMLEEVEKLNQSDKRGYVEVIPGKLRFVKESKSGKASLKFHLVTDETDVWAAYNPYNHNSDSMLNDQFKAAYRRGNIVVVEAEVPVGDLESGYQAPYSKDAVGKTEWKSGDVAAQFPDEMKRTVYLSRYTKPVRVLSNAEVAKWIGERLRKAEQLTGKPITLYEASFHPEVKRLLEADGFTFVPVEQPKGKVSKVLEGHPDYMSDDKIAQINEALSQEDSWLQRGGEGSYSDEEISYENDPLAKWMGESGRSEKARTRMANRVNELAELLHLDNVEVVTDVSTLEGKKARAKGWFSPKTGKIVVVIPNHKSIADVEQTVLHEAVAHYGLRKLFGKHFDDFLWNVYNNASEDVRRKIAGLAVKRGWDFPKATEEYLASLAENTDFENAVNSGWFSKIKFFFMKMLAKAGVKLDVELGDNELRYILWRSYENMAEPGRYRGVIEQAADIAKQYELGVGNYANGSSSQLHVADSLLRENDELSSIIEKAKEDGSYMKAPNGKKSNLNERQWAQVRTRTFKEWFGDWENDPEHASQVLDENKEPRVVYHGTNAQFEVFDSSKANKGDKGYFFTNDSTMANSYGSNQMQVFLNIRKPVKFNGKGHNWNDIRIKSPYDVRDMTPNELDKLSREVFLNDGDSDMKSFSWKGQVEYVASLNFLAKFKRELDIEINRLNTLNPIKYFKAKKNIKFLSGIIKRELDRLDETYFSTTRKLVNSSTGEEDGFIFFDIKDWGPETQKNTQITDNDVYVVKNSNQVKSATNNNGDFNPDDPNIYFRDGEPEVHERTFARRQYEERVKTGMYQMQEALQDSMLGLKEAMKAILGMHSKIEDVDGYENAYLGENRLSSVNQAEADAFARMKFKPLIDEIAKLVPDEEHMYELTDYMMAKHGLERNEVMARRAATKDVQKEFGAELRKAQRAANKDPLDHDAADALEEIKLQMQEREEELYFEYREKDYAGLTALTGEENVVDAEYVASTLVNEYEAAHNTDELWNRVNDISSSILHKSYECGLIDRATFNDVSSMYKHYIPLRGFDETTSSEAYAYLTHKESAFNAPIKKAMGRKSKADNPLAYLQSMAESTIMQGNRNKLVKQRFLNFALNHPSDLVSVSELWLKYNELIEEWEPVFPDNIEASDTAEEVEQKMLEFEKRMAELAQDHPDIYKKGKDTIGIPYRVVTNRDLHQHQVVVKRNGRDYVITINGNPRAAQALNGQTNPDNEMAGAIGAILRAGESVNRHLSAFYTTRNPDFVASNFLRDLLYTNSMVWVKESPNYALRFHRNYAMTNPVKMKMLLAKYHNGELNMSDKTESLFYQFMSNGGETGYVNIKNIEQHKKDLIQELRKSNGKLPLKKALDLLGERFDEVNRAVENCARFAAFVTSREMGRSVERSIYDAKEISVNFNKKGSGSKFYDAVGQTKIGNAAALVGGLGRSGFVFWNAAIQGLNNFGKQFKNHPTKAYSGLAAMFLLGAIVAQLGADDDDEEDKKASYYNLPEHVRRSNLLFKAGESWVSIPLPVEYRAVYGLGELMMSTLNGKEHLTGGELAMQIASQVSQVMPLDLMNDGGMSGMVPSAIKPFAEVMANKSWTGLPIYKDTPYNKDMPEWTKAYKSANKYIVGLAAAVNEATGGDKYTKGKVDWNPSKVEYLLNGYFGGVFNTINRMAKMAETAVGAREYDPQNFLLLNRVIKAGDERTEHRAINNEYFRLQEELESVGKRLRHYENDTKYGIFDYAEKIDFLYNSTEYAKYEVFRLYKRYIDEINKEMKMVADEEEKKKLNEILFSIKKEMIDKINLIRERK